MAILCFTDGGCRGNPGPGAWAFVLIDTASRKAIECADGEALTTNNRMEMLGAIHALRSLRRDAIPITICSDSRYLIDCCTTWMPGWKRNGWKRKGGELKNVDLLKELDELQRRQQVNWHWVKGHAGVAGNEHVDALLNQAMDSLQAGAPARLERAFIWEGSLTPPKG